MSGQPSFDAVSRGVYHLPWIGPNGEHYLAVVDRHGRIILEATVYAEEHVDAAELALWDLVDRMDPPPRHLFLMD